MRNIFVLLCMATLLYFCTTNSTGSTDENSISGEWQWVVSNGGFAGRTITPTIAGFNLSYNFSSDSMVTFNKNDSVLFNSKFNLSGDTLKIDSISVDQIIKLENDQLIMTENCIDCFEHVYERKTNMSSNIIIVDDFALIDLAGDPLQINSVSINNDFLSISVSYSGGCEEHDIELFAGRTFMESNPVQSQLILAHNAHKDACEAWITETLSFNVAPLKEVDRDDNGS